MGLPKAGWAQAPNRDGWQIIVTFPNDRLFRPGQGLGKTVQVSLRNRDRRKPARVEVRLTSRVFRTSDGQIRAYAELAQRR